VIDGRNTDRRGAIALLNLSARSTCNITLINKKLQAAELWVRRLAQRRQHEQKTGALITVNVLRPLIFS
jgi:hypothetical protein